MNEKRQLEFLLVRYAPDAVKGEFVNIGVILLEPDGEYADVRFTQDWRRAKCLDPAIDVEMLQALEAEIRERIIVPGTTRELMLRKVLQDWFSGTLLVTDPKACLAESPARELESLVLSYLHAPRPEKAAREASGRAALFHAMRAAFMAVGVWDTPQMRKRIAVSDYTRTGDPLRIDCGYRPNGVVRLFHAVSLESDPDAAKILSFSYPQIREGLQRKEQAVAELTAIVEDNVEENDEVRFALHTLRQGKIGIVQVSQLNGIAARAREELRL